MGCVERKRDTIVWFGQQARHCTVHYLLYITVCICETLSMNKVNQIFVPFLFFGLLSFPWSYLTCLWLYHNVYSAFSFKCWWIEALCIHAICVFIMDCRFVFALNSSAFLWWSLKVKVSGFWSRECHFLRTKNSF